jgi:hypothetical protein
MNYKPGVDVLTGGIDWARLGVDNVEKGVFTATVGGHFMDGGLSLVMVYDYYNGVPLGENIKKHKFYLLDKKNILEYKKIFNTKMWSKIDFKALSKFKNPIREKYDFSLKSIFGKK